MMCGAGFNVLKCLAGLVVVSAIVLTPACKQSNAEKNAAIVAKEMPEMQIEKDSLKMEMQQAKQEFEVLKSKIDKVPSAVLDKPENAKLSRDIQSIVKKSEQMELLIPEIEAKLEQLTRANQDNPSEAVQHEIEVMKERLKSHRARMDNYMEFYKKLGNQLDSIQEVSQ